MTESPGARVPDDVRWWLAHEGIAALAWDGTTGAVLAATPTARRLLGRDPEDQHACLGTIHEAFALAPGTPGRDVAAWLGHDAPTSRDLPAHGGAPRRRVLVLTWRLPGPAESWGTTCVPLDGGADTRATVVDGLDDPRLLQLQKQEALGRLAGGIAHDFSNLLTVVLGHCDAARQALPRDAPALEDLQGIREAAQQATNLSRQLLTFSRRQVVQPQALQLDDVVARMTPLFKRVLGPGVAFEVVCPPGLPRVLADAGQVEQVLTNLIVNASDALGGAGVVRLTSTLVSASTFAAETGVPGAGGRTYLCLSIHDNGVGMTEEVHRRALEPFFTTKADDRGTGLGLPTVHAIVTQAGGGVSIESTPGQGCDVRLYLPTLPAVDVPAPALPEWRPLPGGDETILLVEDREAVRRVAQRFLARRGYRVLEAEHAEHALEVVEARGAEIDLLLSDVVLGGMDGYALALALTARFPALRVVLMSGYPSEMLARAAGEGPVFPFVSKPIDFPTLAQLLREQLDARDPGRATRDTGVKGHGTGNAREEGRG